MNKCKYLIKSNSGDFNIEFPTEAISGSNKDFEISFYKFLTEHKIDKKSFKQMLVNMEKELVVPSLIKASIIGQDSVDSVSNNFENSRLRSKFRHLSNVLTREWRKKKDGSSNPSTKQNIVFCAFDERYDYEYNKDHDVVFINIAKTVDKNNILKASLERTVHVLGLANGTKSAAQLLKEHDQNVFDALGISTTSSITPADISYLYFDYNTLQKESVVEYLNSKKDTYIQVLDKYKEISSIENRDSNYEPKTTEFIYNLRAGDLVLLESDKEINKNKAGGYYAIFLDYSIDGDGNYIVKAISSNSKYPETKTIPTSEVDVRKQRLTTETDETPLDLSGKFYPIKMDSGLFFSNKFLFSSIKRGDKITIGRTDFVVLNIKGSTFELQNSKGELSTLNDFRKINTIKLNSKVHKNLEYEDSDIANSFAEIKLVKSDDKKFIEENDIVEWGEHQQKGLVLYKIGSVLYVKDLASGTVEKIYDNSVNKHFIYAKNNGDLVATLANEKSSLLNVNPFEYGDYLESDYNWIQYYNGFNLQRGDIVIRENIPFIVVNSINGLYRLFSDGRYLFLNNYQLNGSLIASKRSQDPKLATSSINKNSYFVSNNPDEYSGNYQSYEVNIIRNENTGQVKAIPVNDEIKPHYTLLNKEIKEARGFKNTDKLFAFKKGGISVKNAEFTNPVYNASDNFEKIFNSIIPGTFIKFSNDSKDLKYWMVERKVGDSFLISHSFMRNKEQKTVKKLLNKSDKISELRLPVYAEEVLAKMNKLIGVKESKDISTLVDPEYLPESKSTEVLFSMTELLKNKFNIDVNFVDSEAFKNFGLDESTHAAVINGEYYLNADTASISDPLHEFLHIVLGSMKYSDYDAYKKLVTSVKNHPLFNTVSKVYNETAFDNLEETFIRLFSDTVTNNIAEDGVFSEQAFDDAVKKGIKEMFDLQSDMDNESAYDLLTSDVRTVLKSFSSNLIDNMESLYNKENAKVIIEASSVLRELIKNGNLNEECNGL